MSAITVTVTEEVVSVTVTDEIINVTVTEESSIGVTVATAGDVAVAITSTAIDVAITEENPVSVTVTDSAPGVTEAFVNAAIVTHAAIESAHQDLATIGAGGLSAKLTFTDQILTLAAIDHADLSNVTADQHHNHVTLDVNAATVFSLSTQEIGMETQAAHAVFIGPETGADAVPTVRALVAADIPTEYVRRDVANTFTEPQTITPVANGVSVLDVNQADGTPVLDVDTINRRIIVSSATTGQSAIAAGLIVNNDGGDAAINDFLVKTDAYNAITVDASNDDLLLMSHALGKVAFFGGAPSVQSLGWAITNVTPDKVYDANSTTVDELADVLGSLLTELLSKGLIGA